jgi:hypothetical protein
MKDERLKALLIGESFLGSSHLAKHLQQRSCHCAYATSYETVRSLIQVRDFNLVLSPMRLRDESFFPLIDLLGGSDVTLFYCCPVELGGWWLPALRRGEGCFGSPALRPSEFVSALDEVLAQMRLSGAFAYSTSLSAERTSEEGSLVAGTAPALSAGAP